jgi:hypothetical protein
MQRPAFSRRKQLFWVAIFLLVVCVIETASAASPAQPNNATKSLPKPGSYCPDREILLITAEELAASLNLVMRSRAALLKQNQRVTFNELAAMGTTLHLAASRGAAARTIQLIDAVIQGKEGEDYAQLLTWIPLLQTSLLTLPDDSTVRAAGDLIGRAEDIMQSGKGGDSIDQLKEARHMLACDGLDIPLQAALQAQSDLMKQLGPKTTTDAFDDLLEALNNALLYTLTNSTK